MKKFLTLLLFSVVLFAEKSVFSAEIFFNCEYIAEIGVSLDRNFNMRSSHNEDRSHIMFFLDTNTMTARFGGNLGKEGVQMKAVMSKAGTVAMSISPDTLETLNDYDVIGISYIMVPISGYKDKYIGEQLAFKTEDGGIKNSIIRGICTSKLMK